jgi:two-component system, NarL family, nitrate/nitrite response regulator NarL
MLVQLLNLAQRETSLAPRGIRSATQGVGDHRMTLTRTTVLGADAQPLFMAGLAAAIRSRPELELVEFVRDGRSALEGIRRRHPNVAIVDESLGELSAHRIVSAVRRDGLPTRVVVMGATPEPDGVYRAMADGAAGYITKDATAGQVCDTVSAVARGETVIAPELQGGLVGEIRLRAEREGPVLSQRESQVLTLIGDGLSSSEIAEQLFLSTSTVKTHQHHAYEKLGVSERAAAVATALRRGLID